MRGCTHIFNRSLRRCRAESGPPGIPAVIATQFEISDQAAMTLSQEFYGALSKGSRSTRHWLKPGRPSISEYPDWRGQRPPFIRPSLMSACSRSSCIPRLPTHPGLLAARCRRAATEQVIRPSRRTRPTSDWRGMCGSPRTSPQHIEKTDCPRVSTRRVEHVHAHVRGCEPGRRRHWPRTRRTPNASKLGGAKGRLMVSTWT